MRARATARLLFVAIAAALAVGSAAQPRLVAPEEPNGAIPAAYQRDVRQVFAEAHGADVVLRAIVLPGFGVEFAVGLRRRGAGYEIFSLTPSEQIWAFQRLAMLRSGEMGATVLEGGGEGEDMLSGELRDISGEEIARLEALLPEDPTELPLARCAVAVDSRTAAALVGAWQTMLEAMRPGDELEVGADGTSYLFSMEIGVRSLSGEAWSPERRSRPGRLARIAEAMRDHCGDRREETLREIVALARQLGRPSGSAGRR